jgi:hypothetical protein
MIWRSPLTLGAVAVATGRAGAAAGTAGAP